MKFKPDINYLLISIFVYSVFGITGCADNQLIQGKTSDSQPKINGLCLEGPPKRIDAHELSNVLETYANWVAITPYAFLPSDQTMLNWNSKYTWWGEKKEGVLHCVKLAKQQGLKVMLKPHIWIARGEYTGNLKFDAEEQWTEFENSYREYLYQYLELFSESEIDMVCIGTELDEFAINRPQYWKSLAEDIREDFKVSVTYSANWDLYQALDIWSSLDFIGISAYFPLVLNSDYSLNQFEKEWLPHKKLLVEMNKQFNKPILFTEYGYRSIEDAASKPWISDTKEKVNQMDQKKAYQAIYKTFWNESWFAGGFSWKWYLHNGYSNERLAMDYTVQGKPALEIMKEQYGNHSY